MKLSLSNTCFRASDCNTRELYVYSIASHVLDVHLIMYRWSVSYACLFYVWYPFRETQGIVTKDPFPLTWWPLAPRSSWIMLVKRWRIWTGTSRQRALEWGAVIQKPWDIRTNKEWTLEKVSGVTILRLKDRGFHGKATREHTSAVKKEWLQRFWLFPTHEHDNFLDKYECSETFIRCYTRDCWT